MQKRLLVLAATLATLSCSRNNPAPPTPNPVDSTAALSAGYLVSTYVSYKGQPDDAVDVAISPDGSLYACGTQGNIWKIQADSTALLVATVTARAMELAFDPKGNIYVLNIDYKNILRVTPTGVVTPFAGGALQPVDGRGTAAGFSYLNDLVVDSTGTIYVADGNTIRKIDTSGSVITLYKNPNSNTQISAITLDKAHNIYYATLNQLWRLDATGTNTFIAGDTGHISKDGVGAAAGFQAIWALQVDKNSDLMAGDNTTIRQITPSGVVGTIAGSTVPGSMDGPGDQARFFYVVGLAIDPRGIIYAADVGNARIRKIVHK